ncbi:hypothetical protein PF007_g29084 [Phytophthora fragariae]|uniref:Prephenate dehydratase domain-containing protein n=2 Tax=Phytophthora fragariae TaxID=53985 RepID=A0A6A3PY00_9STRA|nr:hypothetical protein PF003_g29865 [Phytophthora fragariae]KAE9064750.1 hypothetical protein PF007_g29084 [Phytophthora fragariae]KAE9172692.1 hypothetical protein PF004_g27201 [Phytophthora fragariae]
MVVTILTHTSNTDRYYRNDQLLLKTAYKSAKVACATINGAEADFVVLPIESSTLTSIHTKYDLLSKYGLYIVGEYDLQQQQEEAAPVQDASSYTRFLLLLSSSRSATWT